MDDFTPEALALVVDASIGGRRMARELDALIARRGEPALIVTTTHGGDVESHAGMGQPDRRRLAPHRSWQAQQNGFVEGFNGKFCGERLNEEGFTTLAKARAVIGR